MMRKLMLTTLVLFALFCTATQVSAQNMNDEEMKAWQALMTPGENHAWLGQMAGDWTTHHTMWNGPDMPPETMEGKCSKKMILGGRFLESYHTGTMMGMPFEGLSRMGYDNGGKMYLENWIDNFGTGFLDGKGERKDNTLTMNGIYSSQMNGMDITYRLVTTFIDKDSHKLEMYRGGPSGEMKTMEIIYKRVK